MILTGMLNISSVAATYAKFGLLAGNMKFNTKNEE
jgi:hypothetical protein